MNRIRESRITVHVQGGGPIAQIGLDTLSPPWDGQDHGMNLTGWSFEYTGRSGMMYQVAAAGHPICMYGSIDPWQARRCSHAPYDIRMIAPSHGQVYDDPDWILDAYRDWVLGGPHNLVVLPFVSMHGSTRRMVDHLASAIMENGVRVELFNLAVTDIGKLAIALRPKAQFLSVIGSFGWGGKTVETLAGMIPNLKVEVLDPVLCKGLPGPADYKALDRLAGAIAQRHKEKGFG